MFEHVVIQLCNTFPSSVMKVFDNACIDKTLHSTLPNIYLAFCTPQTAVDRFSANSAAAYRSFFSFFITASAVCCISSHRTLVLFRFILYSLTNLWYLAGTISPKHITSNLRVSSFTPTAVVPTLIISHH